MAFGMSQYHALESCAMWRDRCLSTHALDLESTLQSLLEVALEIATFTTAARGPPAGEFAGAVLALPWYATVTFGREV